jgi:hypothetical protein
MKFLEAAVLRVIVYEDLMDLANELSAFELSSTKL